MVCLRNEQRSFCHFWDCIQVLHLGLFVDHDGYFISSKGFLPAVVDIMVIWVKFTYSSPFQFTDSWNVDVHSCHLLFDHLQFAFIHGPNIPGSYPILLFTRSGLASITSHIHNWVLFFLWLHPFLLSGVISPLICSKWVPTNLESFSFSILSFCLFILFMGFSRQEYWSGFHSLLQWTTFCQTSPPWPIHLGWPNTAWLSFTELDKAVVCVIRLASFLVIMVSVCLPSDDPLKHLPWCFTWCLTWISLTLGLLSLHGCSSKAQPLLLSLDEVAPPDLERGLAPFGPPVLTQPPLFGRGVTQRLPIQMLTMS